MMAPVMITETEDSEIAVLEEARRSVIQACSVEGHEALSGPLLQRKDTLQSLGGRFLDASSHLLLPNQAYYAMEIDGQPLYYDDHHLTRFGANVVAPGLEDIFAGLSARQASSSASRSTTAETSSLPTPAAPAR